MLAVSMPIALTARLRTSYRVADSARPGLATACGSRWRPGSSACTSSSGRTGPGGVDAAGVGGAHLILKETLAAPQLLGGAIIFAAITWVQLERPDFAAEASPRYVS